MSSREEVKRATAAVFANGTRVGTAALVDERHLLTAGHVLPASSKVEVEVDVDFIGAASTAKRRLTATSLPLDGCAADIAVLDLGDERPDWLPKPLTVD